jgi:predicted nuclease of restriction endonuclease-like RecB superfamily
MLTVDHVRARRRGGELTLSVPRGAKRDRALDLAEQHLETANRCAGSSRSELERAWDAIDVSPSERRLAFGFRKLIEDRGNFQEASSAIEPQELRKSVFEAASKARASGSFERGAVLEQVASALGLVAFDLEVGLYGDLRAAQVFKSFVPLSAEALLAEHARAEAQAVLLRAVKVVVTVRCSTPAALRRLFLRLKFLQLLFMVGETPDGAHRIEIDGPFSLFESVTKYGLRLAQILPVLEETEQWSLEADLRWGRERTPLCFKREGRHEGHGGPGEPRLPDEITALLAGIDKLGSSWRARPANEILNLPGAGLCVPDLVFERGGDRVFFELLGYYSRDAVFRRVEMVDAGLSERILFAASSRLRVSEELLDPGSSAALYVFKGSLRPQAVLDRIERLASHGESSA